MKGTMTTVLAAALGLGTALLPAVAGAQTQATDNSEIVIVPVTSADGALSNDQVIDLQLIETQQAKAATEAANQAAIDAARVPAAVPQVVPVAPVGGVTVTTQAPMPLPSDTGIVVDPLQPNYVWPDEGQ